MYTTTNLDIDCLYRAVPSVALKLGVNFSSHIQHRLFCYNHIALNFNGEKIVFYDFVCVINFVIFILCVANMKFCLQCKYTTIL